MNDRREIFKGLCRICEDISNSKLIMFNGGLSQLLTYIAKHKSLMDFIKDCNIAVDYRKEFYEATSGMTDKGFKMPDDNRKIVALVTGILFDIDRQEIEFYKFLKSYFDVGDINDCYMRFIENVLQPYCLAFTDYLEEKPLKLSVEEPPQPVRTAFDVISEQVLPFVETIYQAVYDDGKLDENNRREFVTMLEGFCYALEEENSSLLKYLWIGLKNTFSGYRAAEKFLGGISIILRNYGIIE